MKKQKSVKNKKLGIRRIVCKKSVATTDKNKKSIIPTNTTVIEKKEKKVRTPSSEKMYFTKDTEDAIVSYNRETDYQKREDLYNHRIKHSFEKLVENIFNTFKFTYFQVGPLDVQRETLAHLVSNMDKYDSSKGKAFSYFGIVAKNYLIFHNNNNYKTFNKHVDITENHEDHGIQLQINDKHHENKQNREFLDLVVNFWDRNLTKIFKKQRDLCIAQSVVELLRSVDRLDSFNKKALYLYIREISSCRTQQITKIINKMKTYQNRIKENYLNTGYLHKKYR